MRATNSLAVRALVPVTALTASLHLSSRSMATDDAFAVDIGFVSDNSISFDAANPLDQTIIGAITRDLFALDTGTGVKYEADAVFGVDNATREFGLVFPDGDLFVLSTITGIPAADTVTGMAFDPTTDFYYLSTTDGATANLFFVNPFNGTSTLVSSMLPPLTIDIAINCRGEMYGHDIADDMLYRIDKRTGTATAIGPTGFDTSFAQGMDFDPRDGTLYACLYLGGGDNRYVKFDLATGAATEIAAFAGEFELAIRGSCPCAFEEDFDGYADGSILVPQGGWEPWDDDPASQNAIVTSAVEESWPHSVCIDGTDDVVRRFSGVSSDLWTVEAQVFVPGGFTGRQFFILLNRYLEPPSGASNWSLQLEFDGDQDLIIDRLQDDPGPTMPLVRDRWVDIRVEIDLTTDFFIAYVDDEVFTLGSWTEHVTGDGMLRLAALDLFNLGGTAIYWDNIRLCGPSCGADVNGDSIVGFDDLLAVLAQWGPYLSCPPYEFADIDRNCAVDFQDLLTVLAEWGPCPGG